MTPTPKVAAAGVSGAVAVILVWAAKAVFGIDVPAEVAAALAVVISVAGGYIKRENHPPSYTPRRAAHE